MSVDDRKEFNPNLNKYETRNPEVEELLKELSVKIQTPLPETFRFCLFLFQEVPAARAEDVTVNIFYSASATTDQLLPLLNQWIERQKN